MSLRDVVRRAAWALACVGLVAGARAAPVEQVRVLAAGEKAPLLETLKDLVAIESGSETARGSTSSALIADACARSVRQVERHRARRASGRSRRRHAETVRPHGAGSVYRHRDEKDPADRPHGHGLSPRHARKAAVPCRRQSRLWATTRPEIDGHLRRGDLHPLARHRGRAWRCLEKRRQRLRRRRRHGHLTLQVVEPHHNGPRRRDALGPQRSSAPARPKVDLRPGAGAGRRPPVAALPAASASTWCRAPGCSPAGRPRPLRRLDAAAAPTTAAMRPRATSWRRRSVTRAPGSFLLADRAHATISNGRGAVPPGMARLSGGLAARRRTAPAAGSRCSPAPRWPRPATRESLREAEERRAADRARARSRPRGKPLVPRLRRRGDRSLLPHQKPSCDTSGRRPPRPAHRRRHGALAGDVEVAAHLRLRPTTPCCKAGPVDAGAGACCSSLALLEGFDLDGLGPGRPRTSSTTVAECSKLAFADRDDLSTATQISSEVPIDAAVATAYNDERRELVGDDGVARAAPGLGGRTSAAYQGWPAAQGHRQRRSSWRGRGRADRSARHRRRCAATPCISTSSTSHGNMISGDALSGGWLH